MKLLHQVFYNKARMIKLLAETSFEAIETAKTKLNMHPNSSNGQWNGKWEAKQIKV